MHVLSVENAKVVINAVVGQLQILLVVSLISEVILCPSALLLHKSNKHEYRRPGIVQNVAHIPTSENLSVVI